MVAVVFRFVYALLDAILMRDRGGRKPGDGPGEWPLDQMYVLLCQTLSYQFADGLFVFKGACELSLWPANSDTRLRTYAAAPGQHTGDRIWQFESLIDLCL
jgi:hypothetical protein